MADLTVKTRIVIRNSDKASFDNSELILLKGELAVELDSSGNGKFKVGDGEKRYNQLPYITLTPTEITAKLTEVNTLTDNKLNNFIKNIDVNGRSITYEKGDNSSINHDIVYKNEELGQGYCECDTDDSTVLTASIPNFILKAGGIVVVKFNHDVPTDSTLNISNTGNIPIYCFGSVIITGFINSGDVVTLIYDGIRYHIISIIQSSNSNIIINSNKPDFPCTWIETDA